MVPVVIGLLSGCGGLGAPTSSDPRSPTAVGTTPSPAVSTLPQTPTPTRVCANGRLTVGDLLAVNDVWVTGVEKAAVIASDWRADARLVELRVGCDVLESAFRWQGLYYSESAQSFFYTDTGETEPAEIEPSSVPSLPTGLLDFVGLHRALARAGFSDTIELTAANGVEMRINTDISPFGPPEAPKDVVYYHVALHDQGEIRDVFVSANDWVLYLYRSR